MNTSKKSEPFSFKFNMFAHLASFTYSTFITTFIMFTDSTSFTFFTMSF